MTEPLPSAAGSYALLFRLPRPVSLMVGRLGEFDFELGDYLYLGSAMGSGGLQARIRHHLKVAEKPHWHLDWLRSHFEAEACFYALGGPPLECVWSRDLRIYVPTRGKSGVRVPAPGFGASDCRQGCDAHFLRLPEGLGIDHARQLLQESGNRQVFVIMLSDEVASR